MQRISSFHLGTRSTNSSSMRIGYVAVRRACLILSLAILTAGCLSLGRQGPTDESVITGRRLCQQGLEAMHGGRSIEAEAKFGQAIDSCPADYKARQYYAHALWQRGAADRAIAEMRSAIGLSGGDPRLMVELGQMHLSRGELSEAARHAELALQANAQLADAWTLRGDVLDKRGQSQAALDSYHRGLNYSPDDARLQMKVAEAYHRQGRPRRALATLQRLTDHYEPGHEPQRVLYLQGLSLAALNRNEEAVAMLTAASRQGPSSTTIMYHLAQSALKAGNLAAAHWAAEETLRLGVPPQDAKSLLARIESAQQAATQSMRR